MPSTRRWSVPPKRIAATAVLGVIGLFLVCGSVGMGAWLVGAIGIAVIAVGGGVLVLSALNSRATSEIEGTAHVLSVSAPPSGVTHGRCRLNLVLYGKGINGVGVKIRDAAVPVAKWPDAGTDLPVMISIDKPQRSRVLWGDVPTHREAAEQRARAREAEEQAVAKAAEDEYASLDAALDDLDSDLDGGAAEPSLADAGVDEPPPTDSSIGDPIGAESSAGEAYQAAGEPAIATGGTRTIEMDVMDPSVMRWTGPPPARPYGSRPSPFRRRRTERVGPAEPAPDEPLRDGSDAPAPTDAEPPPTDKAPPTDAEPVAAEADSVADLPAADLPAADLPAAVLPVDGNTVTVASDDNDVAAVSPAPPREAPTEAPTATSIGSGLMVDNGRLVAFDLFDQAPAVSPAAAGTSRSAPPEWPPRSAAAAAAAAALPHQWDDEDVDDRTVAGEAVSDGSAEWAESAEWAGSTWWAESAESDTADTTGDGTTGGSGGEGDRDSTAHRVPRNRPAPADELFDQDAPPDDGPGYSPDTAYADDVEYDPDAGYNSDAGYAEPGQANPAS
jgi:hypothetical protein